MVSRFHSWRNQRVMTFSFTMNVTSIVFYREKEHYDRIGKKCRQRPQSLTFFIPSPFVFVRSIQLSWYQQFSCNINFKFSFYGNFWTKRKTLVRIFMSSHWNLFSLPLIHTFLMSAFFTAWIYKFLCNHSFHSHKSIKFTKNIWSISMFFYGSGSKINVFLVSC